MALEKMREAHAPAIGVIDAEHRLLAYITPENLGGLMTTRRAAKR